MTAENYTLKECLVEYLNGDLSMMPIVEAQILSFAPLRITDDAMNYFEISSIEEEVRKKVFSNDGSVYAIQLLDWTFDFVKVPNSHEYYLDIKVLEYNLRQT